MSEQETAGNASQSGQGTTPGKASQSWTNTQAYVMAVVCLLVGCAVGYLLRGTMGAGSAPAQAPAVTQEQAMPQGMPSGMGGGGMPQQMPSPEQMKMMADKAAAPLLERLKSNPNDPALLAQAGNVYYDAQIFPVAIDYYQKSLAADPKNSSVRTDMATAMFYANDPDHAIAQFDQALKDDPKNGNALFNRGIVKWQAKMDVSGAVADWEKLLKENPSYPQADQVRMYIAQAKKHANIKPGQKTDKPAM
jgi:cytochrome c-type biogenesis protein CcmH/NrfG